MNEGRNETESTAKPTSARPTSSRGRTCLLTPEIRSEFMVMLSNSIPVRSVLNRVMISRATFYNWMKRGKAEESGEFREFFDDVTDSIIDGMERDLIAIAKGNEGWRGRAWLLEKRFPREFGRHRRELKKLRLEIFSLAKMIGERVA